MSRGEMDPRQAARTCFDALVDADIDDDGPFTEEQCLVLDLSKQHLMNNGLSEAEATSQMLALLGGAVKGSAHIRNKYFGEKDA